METHPVPKNVLTVEFKLFGALTASQFFRILGSCIAGLVLFVLPIPRLVTIPIIFAVVALGIASALVPGFGVRILGVIKALLVSPQYVWKKEMETPDVLTKEQKKTTKTDPQKQMRSAAPDLTDVSIDRLLSARAQSRGESYQDSAHDSFVNANIPGESRTGEQTAPANTFDRLYQDAFDIPDTQRPAAAPAPRAAAGLADGVTGTTSIPTGGNTQANISPVVNTAPRNALVAQPAETSADQTQTQVQALQVQLAQLSAQQQTAPAAEQAQITDQINALYAQLQELVGPSASASPTITQPAQQHIFGVVVDKQNQPVAGAKVILVDNDQKQRATSESGVDGRFALEAEGLAFGEYVVRIEHSQYKFLEYKISYSANALPAFKFRAQ